MRLVDKPFAVTGVRATARYRQWAFYVKLTRPGLSGECSPTAPSHGDCGGEDRRVLARRTPIPLKKLSRFCFQTSSKSL